MIYITKLFLILKFACLLAAQICIANFRMAYYIIIPSAIPKPGVIAYPLDSKNDLEITFLVIIISLTPGTLALDISSDKKHLYLHSMFISNKETIIDDIKNNIEFPLKRILSWK